MNIDFSRSSHIWFFGGAIPLCSWFISSQIFIIFPDWPYWLEGGSPLFIYAIIFYLFNKYGWRFDIFRKLGIVWFPNLNGRWKGSQRSSFKESGRNVEIEGRIEIKQNFSSLRVQAFYEASNSEGVTAKFSELHGQVYLFFTYDNDPTTFKSGTMTKHKGSVKIKLLPEERRLKGCYWNTIGNYGEMEYEYDQEKLLGRF